MTTVSGAAQAPANNNPGVITDSNSLNKTFSNFLTLLTTQLQHQDPTAPMDTAKFTDQLVSFSQVEQQLKSNAYLEELISFSKNTRTALGLSYIGLNVSIDSNKFSFDPNKYANVTVSYKLDHAATSSKVNILDAEGKTVFSTNGAVTSEQTTYTWDGKDNSGNPVPPGVYTLQVAAFDEKNTPIGVSTQVPGTVSGMQTAEDGSTQLMVGGQLVPLDKVLSAYLPVTAAPSAPSSEESDS
jgi:flagellar basal-body rod modification protein FlgD